LRQKFKNNGDLMGDDKKILQEIDELRAEHRTIDLAITELTDSVDMLRLQRLKKRKLIIRDRIAMLESMLYPDIIA
jgi:hypothetical protein